MTLCLTLLVMSSYKKQDENLRRERDDDVDACFSNCDDLNLSRNRFKIDSENTVSDKICIIFYNLVIRH